MSTTRTPLYNSNNAMSIHNINNDFLNGNGSGNMSVFSVPIAPPPSLPQHPSFQPKNAIPPPPHPKLANLTRESQQSKSIESILNESTAGKSNYEFCVFFTLLFSFRMKFLKNICHCDSTSFI